MSPDEAYASFERELDLLVSAQRTGAPTRDPASDFYVLPPDEFAARLATLRDEIEQRAYFAIVAAAEGILQVDFRRRAKVGPSVPLKKRAKLRLRTERGGPRLVLEDILDEWANVPVVRVAAISEFRQLLDHRHWLAHGRYFANRSGVPQTPEFAIARTRALMTELARVDGGFPRD